MKIAMWSGPRNLSTAMMYAFGARPDFAVWDEPFYGAYLVRTGIDHPMRREIVENCDTDPDKVAARCAGPNPEGKPHFYMKHMPHHICDGFPLDWTDGCTSIHLIRHPARVIASYAEKRQEVCADDIGFRQQAEIYAKIGGVVVDSADLRENPSEMLSRLCDEIGLNFDPAMLHWPAGGHKDDGPWAPHWYGAIHNSTRFAGPEGPLPKLTGRDAELCAQTLPYYDTLVARKISL